MKQIISILLAVCFVVGMAVETSAQSRYLQRRTSTKKIAPKTTVSKKASVQKTNSIQKIAVLDQSQNLIPVFRAANSLGSSYVQNNHTLNGRSKSHLTPDRPVMQPLHRVSISCIGKTNSTGINKEPAHWQLGKSLEHIELNLAKYQGPCLVSFKTKATLYAIPSTTVRVSSDSSIQDFDIPKDVITEIKVILQRPSSLKFSAPLVNYRIGLVSVYDISITPVPEDMLN